MDIPLFPTKSLLSYQSDYPFHQSFLGVSPRPLRRFRRFLDSCVAALVQLRTCHRRWQREPVIALVARLQTVQSFDIGCGYFMTGYD